ncbi:NAD(P)H-hydrate dehydratase [Hyphobacterium sp.]|uniref:NAD(P)H-hydrate dehydratase n=1 Tax=Hyphobacterium sp. TaxID=2004662 RepID=UPI003B52DD00
MQPLANKILSVDGHRAADAFAVANGVDGVALMEAAGRAVADAIERRWNPRATLILCGPGNNGGDGFVVARHLAAKGWPIEIATLGATDHYKSDAAEMCARWTGRVRRLDDIDAGQFDLFVDALFGAGLSRPLEGSPRLLATALAEAGRPVIAVDIPSGIHGDLGRPLDTAFKADLTVTFHRLKPAHLLQPGRAMCGEIVLADIGIPDGWESDAPPIGNLNAPTAWLRQPFDVSPTVHKHGKGRLCVVSGGPSATGAARLAAGAGLRSGAGLVTLLSPPAAMQVNAMHETAVMLHRFDDDEGLLAALDDRRATAVVIGPGNGVGSATRDRVIAASAREAAMVLDADALTSFSEQADHLFDHLRADDVLTPHDGEFARLFPDLACDEVLSKIDRGRRAAERAGCTIVLKGADTVIAGPDGAVRVNVRAAPSLATAGTGDVLAGLIGGLLAQGHGGFEAASMAVWLHGEAGLRLGDGLVAEDLPAILPAVFLDLRRRMKTIAARRALNAGANSA